MAADGEAKTKKREQWSSPVEFVLSCMALAVGLGNIWRFPYICYVNGGGAFLIPYAIMLTFVAVPLLMIELAIGQYSASGPMTVWQVSPLFHGVGVGMMVIAMIADCYYTTLCAWAMYYLFASFQAELPWKTCDHPSYNTENCYSRHEAEPCESRNGTWFNQTCYNETYVNSFDVENEFCNMTSCWNSTYNTLSEKLQNATERRVSPSEEYFNHGVLGRSDAMEDTIGIKWDICLTILLSWIICCVCVSKGIKSAGKVVYFTATFPFLVLSMLLVMGLTLPGSTTGILYFVYPDWEKMKSPKVWIDAAGQIFFSTNVAMGGMMTMASYNKFNKNVYRDAMIVAIGNSLTSLFAGFVVFAILGFMAYDLGLEVKDVVKSGSGLAFVAYPGMVNQIYPPQLWSSLFFLMLMSLGLGSEFVAIENVMTAIIDMKPSLRSKRYLVALVLCSILFLMALPMSTAAGVFWLELMSYYSTGWSVVLLGLAESIIFPWVYGARRIREDILTMTGIRLGPHWIICWLFITPSILLGVLIFNLYQFTPLSYGDYMLPAWAQALGWMMALTSVLMIPTVAVMKIILSYRKVEFQGLTFCQRLQKLTKPTDKWIPAYQKMNIHGLATSENTNDCKIELDSLN